MSGITHTLRYVMSKECNGSHNLFSERLFREINLPAALQTQVRGPVFKNLVGRMHPNHSFNRFAKPLVNPEIKGANYFLAKTIFEAAGARMPYPTTELCMAVEAYITQLSTSPTCSHSYFTLLEMSCWITALIGAEPLDGASLITSSDAAGTAVPLHEQYAEGFAAFCVLEKYLPAFNLAAVRATLFGEEANAQ